LFTAFANDWSRQNLHPLGIADIQGLWRQAQALVEKDLREADTKFQNEIAAAIAEIKARCLGIA
jgi:hypothetical protein